MRLWLMREAFLKVWLCGMYGDGSFDSQRNVPQGRQMCGAFGTRAHYLTIVWLH